LKYDATGNRQRMRALVWDIPGGDYDRVRVETYDYDQLDRLKGYTSSIYGSGPVLTNSADWTYDVMGNRSTVGQSASTYDGLNRILTAPGATYSHDWLGNRTSETGKTYTWDFTNRMTGMVSGGNTYTYTYRADGLRTKRLKTAGGLTTRTEYYYDGQMPVIERDYDNAGALTKTRVNFLGARGIEGVITIEAETPTQGTLTWLTYDGHGNVVRTMSTGFVLSGFHWRDPWGAVEPNNNNTD
jgi:hypothetical protein